jgi:hypothetical protein
VDVEGFVKIPNKRKVVRKGNKPTGESSKKDSNSFQALEMEDHKVGKNEGEYPKTEKGTKVEKILEVKQ